MGLEQTERLLQQAAAAAYDRIEQDRQGVSTRVGEALDLIKTNLFDPDLDIGLIKRSIGISGNSFSCRFHQEVGMSPKAYIIDCRFQVASHLLQASNLPVWKIAVMVGFSGLPTFSSSFTKWAGTPPTRFRANGSCLPARLMEKWNGTPLLRRAVRGELSSEEAEPLLLHLNALYRPSAKASVPSDTAQIVPDGVAFDQLRAEQVWHHVRKLPAEEQMRYISAASFGSPALFDLLREKSLILGRQSRKDGVTLALLAMESLRASEERLQKDMPNLLTQAWTWIGNARRLASDLAGAEQAFKAAEECWEISRHRYDWKIKAELCAMRSCLLELQGRTEEALALIEEAVTIVRKCRHSALLARCLVQHAIICIVGDRSLKKAIESLNEAGAIAQEIQNTRLAMTAYCNLIVCEVLSGRYEKAQCKFDKLLIRFPVSGDVVTENQYLWLDGLIAIGLGDPEKGERRLLQCREGFILTGNRHHASLVTLDLALLYQKQGRSAEVIALAAEVISLLDSSEPSERPQCALRLLRKSVVEREIALATLQQVRRLCLRATLHP